MNLKKKLLAFAVTVVMTITVSIGVFAESSNEREIDIQTGNDNVGETIWGIGTIYKDVIGRKSVELKTKYSIKPQKITNIITVSNRSTWTYIVNIMTYSYTSFKNNEAVSSIALSPYLNEATNESDAFKNTGITLYGAHQVVSPSGIYGIVYTCCVCECKFNK